MKKFLLTLALCLATLAPVQSAGVLFLAQAPSGASCTPGTQATNFLARTTGLSGTETTAYCNLINGLVSDGIITGTMNGANSGAGACGVLLDAFYIVVTNSTTTATLNLCGTSYGLTLTGTCTFTADSGYPCNGSTGFFKTGFIANGATTPNFVQNSAFLGVWITTSRTASVSKVPLGAANSGGQAAYMDPLSASNFGYAINLAFGSAGVVANSDAKGAWLVNRSASNLTSVYKNGSATAIATSANASLVDMSTQFYVSALNNNGTTSNFSDDAIGAVVIGGGATPLTAAQAAAIENRVNTYLAVFGKSAF